MINIDVFKHTHIKKSKIKEYPKPPGRCVGKRDNKLSDLFARSTFAYIRLPFALGYIHRPIFVRYHTYLTSFLRYGNQLHTTTNLPISYAQFWCPVPSTKINAQSSL